MQPPLVSFSPISPTLFACFPPTLCPSHCQSMSPIPCLYQIQFCIWTTIQSCTSLYSSCKYAIQAPNTCHPLPLRPILFDTFHSHNCHQIHTMQPHHPSIWQLIPSN